MLQISNVDNYDKSAEGSIKRVETMHERWGLSADMRTLKNTRKNSTIGYDSYT